MFDEILLKYTQQLSRLVVQVLESKGLHDTGELAASFRAMEVNDNQYQIVAKDYFKYLDSRYGIMDTVYSTEQYKEIQKERDKAIAKYLEKEITKK